MIRSLIIISSALAFTSCATMKSWMGGSEPETPVAAAPAPAEEKEDILKYSDSNNMAPPSDRNYKRMTKARMEEESELQAQAGSLWMMEGQNSFLFTQNKMRREGDSTNVRLEGASYKQVESKVSVIKGLLKQLEDRLKQQEENAAAEKLAAQQKAADEAASADGDRKPAAVAKPVVVTPVAKQETEKEKIDLSDVSVIPTRIIERVEGSYRVRGSQTFLIGQQEYKVIATGIIRQEDFNDEGVSSNKLLEPQFDVVHVKRKAANEIR